MAPGSGSVVLQVVGTVMARFVVSSHLLGTWIHHIRRESGKSIAWANIVPTLCAFQGEVGVTEA